MRHWAHNAETSAPALARALATGALALAFAGCGTNSDPNTGATVPDGIAPSAIYTETIFLPDSGRTRITLSADSTVVVRLDSRDSMLTNVRRVNSDAMRRQYDSASEAFGAVAAGDYKRENVIDGTRIWVHHRGKRIYCDNCLHDFILEASGALSAGSGTKAQARIKTLVRHINQAAMEADPAPGLGAGVKIVTVVTDRTQLKDTNLSYEVHKSRKTDTITSLKIDTTAIKP